MRYPQKKFFNSSASAIIQILNHVEKFLFSAYSQKVETALKHSFKINVAKKIFNPISLVYSICKLPEHITYTHKNSETSNKKYVPLIKATTKPISAASAVCTSNNYFYDQIQADFHINYHKFSGKFVLCIGGRSRLYPEYRSLIESLGGNLLVYRGNQKGDLGQLPVLLACADMVVCPIDCVHHETYFDVKYYCKKSGKPCALLDRSDLPTFHKGIEALIRSLSD